MICSSISVVEDPYDIMLRSAAYAESEMAALAQGGYEAVIKHIYIIDDCQLLISLLITDNHHLQHFIVCHAKERSKYSYNDTFLNIYI